LLNVAKPVSKRTLSLQIKKEGSKRLVRNFSSSFLQN
jgi:hypothetical protein